MGIRLLRSGTGAAVLATILSGVALVTTVPTVAHAATATVPNGITTSAIGSPNVTASTVAAALVGNGVSVSNVTFTGAAAQAGLVHVLDPAVVGFNDGIIMSSGDIANVVGPNSSDGITGDMAGAADAALTDLIKNTQTVNPMTYDAAVLEFDFVPTASTVYFTYVFGSDEYLEWVNLFNDVFAFWVNGTNCATVPSGAPVSIDTINSVENSTLFRDNSFSSPPAQPLNIESDGLSVELICSATVNPGQTNHLRLAIADTSDQILDSVVMLKAHSLSTTPPESCNDSIDNDDDTMIDMDDSSCQSTTTPPPTGSSGVGSGGSAPAFTGVEGSDIVLDASALGWTPTADTVTTHWTVEPINGTVGSCTVSPAGEQHVLQDGAAAVAYAVCSDDGEYVAHIFGSDIEGKGSWDTDVDFFVQNAPPAVQIDSPIVGDSASTGTEVTMSATVADPGATDTVSCEVSWGDGTTSTTGTVANGTCSAVHTYTTPGNTLITATVTDGAGDSAAAATVLDVTGAPVNHAPTADAGTAITAAEGATITLAGSATDVDGDALTTLWTVIAGQGADTGATCTIKKAADLATTAVCNDDGTFTFSLSANDGTVSATDTVVATVSNVAPTVTVTTPAVGAIVKVSTLMTVSATVADAGKNDTLTCTVAWGDGTANTTGAVSAGVCTASHTYTAVSTGRTITVTVSDDDNASTVATRTVVVAAAPTIKSFTPTTGGTGTAVTITGANFTGATAVKFNTTLATKFTVVSSTTIVVGVPAGATTGKISVTTPVGTVTSTGSITLSGTKAPTISSLSVTSAVVGAKVTVTGTNLGAALTAKVNGVNASFTVSSATVIVVTVPAGATTGKVSVTTAGGTATSTATLTVK